MAPKKRPMWPIAVVIVVIALVAAVVMRSRSTAPPAANTAPAAPPVPVSVATAGETSMTRTIPVIGQLQSNDVVSLTSKIAGKIVRLNVNAGDQVAAGDVVAELDPSDEVNQLHQAQAALSLAQTKYQQLITGQGLKNTQTTQSISSAQANLDAAKAHLSQMITASRIADSTAAEGVKQAQANLASSEQNLAQLREGARAQERAQAQSAVERAQADYSHAQADFSRTDNLFKQGAVSQQARDDASYQVDVAKAALDSARQNASLVEEGTRSQQIAIAEQQVQQNQAALRLAQAEVARRAMSRDDVRQAQEQVRQLQTQLAIAKAGTSQYKMTAQDISAAADQVRTAESQLTQAQEALAETRIVTPVGGIVDTRPVSVGSSVAPTTVLMTVVPERGQYFEAQVPEDAVALVHRGDPVEVNVDALPGRTFKGRVTDIIPVADTATKLYRVHISVEGAGSLPENGFARGSIQVAQVKGIIVPHDALASNVGDFYVYVVQDSHAHRRSVTLGLTSDTQAQVLTGLHPGDQYVVAGVDSVTDGALVTIQPDARSAPAASGTGGSAGGPTQL